MTENDIREIVLHQLAEIAPEVDPGTVRPDVDLRDQFDLDSMDLLNFIVAVDHELGVEIPENDYGEVMTVDGLVGYVIARTG